MVAGSQRQHAPRKRVMHSKNSRKRFLSSLLASFSQSSAIDPIGRNLTKCYACALEEKHEFYEAIFGPKFGRQFGNFDNHQLEIRTERQLPDVGKRKSPKADICILHKGTTRLIAEIKVEDQYTAHSKQQLEGYVRFAKQHKVPFVHITKYALSPEDKEILESLPNKLYLERRHYEIATAIKSIKDSEIAKMISAYLEDEHMSGFQQLENVTNQDFLNFARRLFPVEQGGFGGKLHGEERTQKIGQIIVQWLNNARMISEWLRDDHEDLRLSVYPRVELYWKLKSAMDAWKDDEEVNPDYMEPKFCDGGVFNFIIAGWTKKAPGLWLEVSIWLALDRSRKKKPLKQGLSVEIWHKILEPIEESEEYPYHKENFSLNESEHNTRRAVSRAISIAKDKLKELGKHTDKQIRQFSKSKSAKYVANMTFRDLATNVRD
jgi:hypothetical protein